MFCFLGCIFLAKIVNLNLNFAFAMHKKNVRFYQKSLGKSLAVVFIGSSADADDLLFFIDSLGELDGNVVKFGLRVILASSESSSVDTKVFDNVFSFGEGTLAIGKVTVDMSADLEPDMQALLR